MFAVRFRAAAHKDADGRRAPPSPPDARNLEPGWRDRLAHDLAQLAGAWGDEEAWQGTTVARGIEMPGAVVGLVALDELVAHGWDLAVATGQPYDAPRREVEAAMQFVRSFEAPRDGSLFGPVVPIADAAPVLDRLLALTGRDPDWRPPHARAPD